MKTFLSVLGLSALVVSAQAIDWPQYRGPQFDGSSQQTLSGQSWAGDSPAEIWKVDTATGFSSFAVSEAKAITLELQEVDGNPMEVCVARDAVTGDVIWSTELWIVSKYDGGGNAGTDDNNGGDGPRSTPSISDGRVYVIDANLKVYCLDLATGDALWKRDIIREHSGVNIKWQNAAAPLVDGEHVYLAGGGSRQALMALDKEDGTTVWKSEDDVMTHATPVFAEIEGEEQIIFFTQEGLVAVTPDEGEVLWRYEFPFNVSTAASPVVWENIVYCSAGYGVGAGAVQIEKSGSEFTAEEIWRTENDNINHWSSPVAKDGYLYGMYSFKDYGNGPLACVDIRTGEMKWQEAGFGPGNVVLAGDYLLALSDSGELAIVEASPDGYEEISRADVLDGKCWSTPAIAYGKVYARSTVEGGCFDLGAAISSN